MIKYFIFGYFSFSFFTPLSQNICLSLLLTNSTHCCSYTFLFTFFLFPHISTTTFCLLLSYLSLYLGHTYEVIHILRIPMNTQYSKYGCLSHLLVFFCVLLFVDMFFLSFNISLHISPPSHTLTSYKDVSSQGCCHPLTRGVIYSESESTRGLEMSRKEAGTPKTLS